MQDRFPLGIARHTNGIEMRIWAPGLETCELVMKPDGTDRQKERSWRMAPVKIEGAEGFLSCIITDPPDSFLYSLKLPDGRQIPDPYALENVGGVHAYSSFDQAMLDRRTHDNWEGVAIEDATILEVHIGAFSDEGTFKACKEKLPYIAGLGFSVIQLMPIWLIPGSRNWGYDPVSFWTINPNYGSLEEFKDFVTTAHKNGIAVVIDCVYNHLGPEGSYMPALVPEFLSTTKRTPWGDALALDDDIGAQLQDLILSNIEYWFDHIGIDGMRVDAGEHLRPNNGIGFLCQMAEHARKTCHHANALLFLEHDHRALNKEDSARLLSPQFFDRLWNAPVQLQLSPTASRADNFITILNAITNGALLEPAQERTFSTFDVVSFLRSHDTIGNEGHHSRNENFEEDKLFDAIVLLLLTPTTPMIFMGDEWLTKQPFYFFCDISNIACTDLNESRHREFPQSDKNTPLPHSDEAFYHSKINWADYQPPKVKTRLEAIKKLIGIRKAVIHPFLRNKPHLTATDVDLAHRYASLTWEGNDGSQLHFVMQLQSSQPHRMQNSGDVVFTHILHDHSGNEAVFEVFWHDASLTPQRGKRDESQCLPA